MTSCFLFANDDDQINKINIDDLYEKNQRRDLKQLSIFNKILNRIHKRILITGKNKKNDKHIWFVVPEYIFGEPIYDKSDCIAYVISKLEENGFYIRYVHPNALFISWENWIPQYVRNEIRKKHGIVLDSKGNVIKKDDDDDQDKNIDSTLFNDSSPNENIPSNSKKQYTPIHNYKPTGNFVYNNELFEQLEKKISSSSS